MADVPRGTVIRALDSKWEVPIGSVPVACAVACTTISNGTLKLGGSNTIPSGSGKGNVVFNPVNGNTATLDLAGAVTRVVAHFEERAHKDNITITTDIARGLYVLTDPLALDPQELIDYLEHTLQHSIGA